MIFVIKEIKKEPLLCIMKRTIQLLLSPIDHLHISDFN